MTIGKGRERSKERWVALDPIPKLLDLPRRLRPSWQEDRDEGDKSETMLEKVSMEEGTEKENLLTCEMDIGVW
jgi:hypothetical protein